MADSPPDPTEHDVIKMLVLLAGESRVYRLHLRNAQHVIERLAADTDDVWTAQLLTSVKALIADRLGTPARVEQLAVAALRELKD